MNSKLCILTSSLDGGLTGEMMINHCGVSESDRDAEHERNTERWIGLSLLMQTLKARSLWSWEHQDGWMQNQVSLWNPSSDVDRSKCCWFPFYVSNVFWKHIMVDVDKYLLTDGAKTSKESIWGGSCRIGWSLPVFYRSPLIPPPLFFCCSALFVCWCRNDSFVYARALV